MRALLKGTDAVVLHVLAALGVPANIVRMWEEVRRAWLRGEKLAGVCGLYPACKTVCALALAALHKRMFSLPRRARASSVPVRACLPANLGIELLLFWDCSSSLQGDEELEMFDMESERAYGRAEAERLLVVSPVPGQQRGSAPGKPGRWGGGMRHCLGGVHSAAACGCMQCVAHVVRRARQQWLLDMVSCPAGKPLRLSKRAGERPPSCKEVRPVCSA